jgi:hypothetical protein
LVFFSRSLERLIKKIWSKGPLSRKGKEERPARRDGKPEPGGERRSLGRKGLKGKRDHGLIEAFKPSNLIARFELKRKERDWSKVRSYFRELSRYQASGDRVSGMELEAKILGQV